MRVGCLHTYGFCHVFYLLELCAHVLYIFGVVDRYGEPSLKYAIIGVERYALDHKVGEFVQHIGMA